MSTVTFSSNDRLMISESDDNTVWLWNAATDTEWCVLKNHSDLINAVAFLLNDRLIISESHDKTIQLWNVITNTEKHVLKDYSD